jgi:uracil-DNA glycosylase
MQYNIPTIIHNSWHKHICDFFNEKSILIKIRDLINLPSPAIFPEKSNIFRVFEMPLEEIRLIILGQDPYPTKDDAIGYAFATGNKRKPVSFKIIEEELGHELPLDLITWRKQGVFLLNTALTVEERKPGSHISLWKSFTKRIISTIDNDHEVGWLLMGKYAQSYAIDIKNGYKYMVPHPASEVYSGRKSGFLGSNVFSTINSKLHLSL